MVYLTNPATVLICSFSMSLPRRSSVALTLTMSVLAISLVEYPSAINCNTLHSLVVRFLTEVG